jgi:hypothetical protein
MASRMLSDTWYYDRNDDASEERERIARMAAKLVIEKLRAQPYSKEFYPTSHELSGMSSGKNLIQPLLKLFTGHVDFAEQPVVSQLPQTSCPLVLTATPWAIATDNNASSHNNSNIASELIDSAAQELYDSGSLELEFEETVEVDDGKKEDVEVKVGMKWSWAMMNKMATAAATPIQLLMNWKSRWLNHIFFCIAMRFHPKMELIFSVRQFVDHAHTTAMLLILFMPSVLHTASDNINKKNWQYIIVQYSCYFMWNFISSKDSIFKQKTRKYNKTNSKQTPKTLQWAIGT